MVKTRSCAVSFHASSASEQKRARSSLSSPSPSAIVPRKYRRRRTVAMPARKKKLRRQKALQKEISIAKESQQDISGEEGNKLTKSARHAASKQLTLASKPSDKINPNAKAAGKKFTATGAKIDGKELPTCKGSRKASAGKTTPTVEQGNNFDFSEECTRTREKRNLEAVCQATCKKVRIQEAANACSGARSHDQAIELNQSIEWTSEQDSALQSAYFQVRPSSNFWFEVSKKVPGKTANECFDRFYSAYPTPATAQPRSRKLASESPVRTISFSSPIPSLNSKARFGRGKQGLLKAHQTVRHILRQQRVADGTYEADVFTAVEQFNARNPLLQDYTNMAISPLPTSKGKDSVLKGKDTFSGRSLLGTPASCFTAANSGSELWYSASSKQNSECGHGENAYITRSAAKTQLLSPEVLKVERNPGRLDRFLDVLHLRRVAKRKNTSASRSSQNTQGNTKAERISTQCVADARKAIISDATGVLEAVRQEKARIAAEEETSFLSDHIEEEESLLMSDD